MGSEKAQLIFWALIVAAVLAAPIIGARSDAAAWSRQADLQIEDALLKREFELRLEQARRGLR